jgi:hypothetical protein
LNEAGVTILSAARHRFSGTLSQLNSSFVGYCD